MKIKDLPKIVQPQEKLFTYGVGRLTNDELLAIIIASGTCRMNAITLAHYINKKEEFAFNTLKSIHGLGKTKIARIIAAVEFGKRIQQKTNNAILSAKDVWNMLSDIRASKKEYFIVFYLDVQNQLIQKETISIGTLNASIVHPREVYEPAIRYSAAQIIISHNHPSGECRPSSDDLVLTQRIKKAGELLGIELVDHIIVTKEKYHSFREKRIL